MLVLFFARIKNSNHVQGCRPLVDLQAFREHVYSLLLCWAMLDADIRLFERIIKPLDIYFCGFYLNVLGGQSIHFLLLVWWQYYLGDMLMELYFQATLTKTVAQGSHH